MQSILEYAKKLRAISHLGLTYCNNEYDRERYNELKEISLGLIEVISNQPASALSLYYADKKEYITPKVDIRVVVFNDKKEILLVKEKADGMWSLPGGWADVGSSAKEVAVKEAYEETGLVVEPVKLLAVLDKRLHNHPPALDYVYKMFVQCKVAGGKLNETFDILDKGFFERGKLPPLSLERVLPTQIDIMFEFLDDPHKETLFD